VGLVTGADDPLVVLVGFLEGIGGRGQVGQARVAGAVIPEGSSRSATTFLGV
jgi:hypothetical protein